MLLEKAEIFYTRVAVKLMIGQNPFFYAEFNKILLCIFLWILAHKYFTVNTSTYTLQMVQFGVTFS